MAKEKFVRSKPHVNIGTIRTRWSWKNNNNSSYNKMVKFKRTGTIWRI